MAYIILGILIVIFLVLFYRGEPHVETEEQKREREVQERREARKLAEKEHKYLERRPVGAWNHDLSVCVRCRKATESGGRKGLDVDMLRV